MKEHTYEYNFKKVFMKPALIWFCVVVQLGLNLFVAFNKPTIAGFVWINVAFSLLSIPGIIVHFNHLKRSRNAILVVRYNSISFQNGSTETNVDSTDIQKIILHECLWRSRFPWWNYSWFELIDSKAQSIKVSCYLLEITDFWQDSLSRRVNSNNLTREEHVLPMMK